MSVHATGALTLINFPRVRLSRRNWPPPLLTGKLNASNRGNPTSDTHPPAYTHHGIQGLSARGQRCSLDKGAYKKITRA